MMNTPESAVKQMKYPSDFVSRAKSEFPNWKELHVALGLGSQIVGRMLEDTAFAQVEPEEMISLIDSGRIAQLREHAATIIRRRQLYRDWGKLYDEQVKPLLRGW